MARDVQRRRTYDAEVRAFEGTLAEAPLTFAEIVELATSVTSTAWWHRYGVPVTVTRGRGVAVHSHSERSSGRVVITEVQQNAATLCHELAHAASDDGHGAGFRGALICVVQAVCGRGPATNLADEFAYDGLDVTALDCEGLPDKPLLATHPRFR